MITPFEVRKYSGAGKDYNTNLFCDLIPQIEQEFIRECLGSDLWVYLTSKLTIIPTGSTVWQSCDLYQLSDVVNYFGCLYTSTSNNNATIPGDDGADWTSFSKFTDAACNDLWLGYLRNILAMKVYEPTISLTTMRTGAGGAVVNTGDQTGYRAANKSEISTIKGDILKNIQRATTNMIEWLRINSPANGIPTPWICAQGSCNTTGSQSRRWGMYREQTRLNTTAWE
jgi:hypothetical protein